MPALWEHCDMQDKKALAKFLRTADEVRKIARDLYDKTERQTLLRFVDDCEKLAAENARAGKQPK
jgi:hypothetical protein